MYNIYILKKNIYIYRANYFDTLELNSHFNILIVFIYYIASLFLWHYVIIGFRSLNYSNREILLMYCPNLLLMFKVMHF